jgi:ribosomal protein S12 methylthiotransferase accessory factor YcaO
MTRPDVMREAIVNLRQAERRRFVSMDDFLEQRQTERRRETLADAVKAFLVLALIVVAFYAAALVVASFSVMYR